MTLMGRVFDVSKGCVHDGPGLRTVVFLKGCALDCPWCHNPEGTSRAVQIAHDLERCIRCGRCVEVCPNNPGAWTLGSDTWRKDCDACGRCSDVCPPGARRTVGRELSVDELVDEVCQDADFFEGTGGGVTFSGGEPLMQAEFLFDCAARLSARNIHVAVETAGLFPRRHVATLAERADLVLFDLKHSDPKAIARATGVDARPIHENLEALLACNVALELRVTLVPGFNSTPDDLAAIARWLRERAGARPVKLQPFHRLATGKSGLYGARYAYADVEPTSEAELERAADLFRAHGLVVTDR
ncbi:MAG: glycyl-radical enzyme activating protein [Sandaracinaceae bacterium]|nr:glycyl-radical enzyme activating protein [Sandaracinaceae bacterium]